MNECQLCKTVSICENCNKCKDKLDQNIGTVAFSKNTSDIITVLNESSLGTNSDVYSEFLISSKKYESEINGIIYHHLSGLVETDIPFDTEMYFNLDRIFTQWNSWYRRFLSLIRLLLLHEIECPHVRDLVTTSIGEYYNNSKETFRLPCKDNILKYHLEYFSQIKNEDYTKVSEFVGDGVLTYFRLIIIQYAQQFMIEHKYNRLYYSYVFEMLGTLGDSILKARIAEIKSYSNTIDIYILSPLEESEMNFFDVNVISKYIINNFDSVSVNNPIKLLDMGMSKNK